MDSNFFINNRSRLCDLLPDTLVIIPANKLLQYSMDTSFDFRQESNFLYLTGINEPDLSLMIDTNNSEATIFYMQKNEYQREWDGDFDHKKYQNISGINHFIEENEMNSIVDKAIKKGMKIGILQPYPEKIDPYGFYSNPARKLLYDNLKKYKDSFKDIRKNIATLRQIKTNEEIDFIKKAINITGDSLRYIKNNINNYRFEYEIERDLTINFLKNGGEKHGFEPIVASGENASIIHYKNNEDKINSDSLILLDVGAQVGYYSADISRTYKIGTPKKRQLEIYSGLFDVHKKIVSMVKPGITIKYLQEQTDIELSKLYKKLKIENRKLPHGVSHHLGIDVHDAADYQAELQENMIITIEPGIYLKEESIGVRIEDDILLTKKGNVNLSEFIDY
jgi:Xaa-Pro aminopeptidase